MQNKMYENNKAALELSIGTIVIIVLAMSMLILGLALIRNIFTGALGSAELVDRNVKAQINKLFNEEDTKTVVYLPDNQAEAKKGNSYNIRFAIKNVIRGVAAAGQFTYRVSVREIEPGCQLSQEKALSYIKIGRNVNKPIPILPGDKPKEQIIVFEPSEDAPLCLITFDITVFESNKDYDTNFFTVKITG